MCSGAQKLPTVLARLRYFKEILFTTHHVLKEALHQSYVVLPPWITQPMIGRLLFCGPLQFLDLFLLGTAALGFGDSEELGPQLLPCPEKPGRRHVNSTPNPLWWLSICRLGNQDVEEEGFYWMSMIHTLWNPGHSRSLSSDPPSLPILFPSFFSSLQSLCSQ